MESGFQEIQESTAVSHIEVELPLPWKEKRLLFKSSLPITYIVGPNGSGKSKFASALRYLLPNCRLLGTNRLDMMIPVIPMLGDNFPNGIVKEHFSRLKEECSNNGAGIDAFILLEERLDLQIRVEATLSSLFNREIRMHWDSGRLVPLVSLAGQPAYRLDRQECHGIRELLVLLTYLYDDTLENLIIDEPELNLHPQYQSFFMQEVRNITSQPVGNRCQKNVILITHSPFIIELTNFEDLDAIYSFSSDFQVPQSLPPQTPRNRDRLASLIPHISAYHKQLFFCDNPIFVEGVSDARIVEAIQQARGLSIISAGSCIVEADGCEEVNKFLDLCLQLNKKAYFLYDLDSLFSGNLRHCLKDDGEVSGFLSDLGLGPSFQDFVGKLDRLLHSSIKTLSETAHENGSSELLTFLSQLGCYETIMADNKKTVQAKLSILYDLKAKKTELESLLGAAVVSDIKGKIDQITNALMQKNIFLLPGGTLEDYLPSFQQSHYGKKSDEAKANAVTAEISILQARKHTETELGERYGAFFQHITKLPGKKNIDTETVLKRHLSNYIHAIQSTFSKNTDLTKEDLQAVLDENMKYKGNFWIDSFEKTGSSSFSASINVSCGIINKVCRISDETVTGMGRFTLQDVETES